MVDDLIHPFIAESACLFNYDTLLEWHILAIDNLYKQPHFHDRIQHTNNCLDRKSCYLFLVLSNIVMPLVIPHV